MKHYDLALIGFGNVGRALARLLARKREVLANDYSLTFAITTIITGSHGSAHDIEGLDIEEALELSSAGKSLKELSSQQIPNGTIELIQSCGADVLFENSPVNYESGQPAIDHLQAALESGMHAITANKGSLVHAYQELTELAESVSRKFFFESTVMDGAPVFSLFRETLPGAVLIAFEGILNSTTNLMLARMETGDSFDQAVAYAQSIGIAETDPSGDVDGWDAAIKVAALATVLMGIPTKPSEVDRKGIRAITPDMITQAREAGKRWKLICSAKRVGEKIQTHVAPEMVSPESLFYNIEGTTSIVRFDTDVLGKLSIIENDPGPETTAYGLLADFLSAAKT
ncbi:MAG: homoserine dehydrogenase [Chloroflexi bacterium]|nr:homoserine dehydrogenase [Chloroflexota bacterium]